jgi:hypothetical protein
VAGSSGLRLPNGDGEKMTNMRPTSFHILFETRTTKGPGVRPAVPVKPTGRKQARLIGFFISTLAFFLFYVGGNAFAAQPARITNMTMTGSGDSVQLYFEVENAFNEKLVTAVNSGVNISFSFPIIIYQVRNLWKDKKIAQLDLTSTIKYDTLKKEYIVTRTWKSPEPVKVTSFEEAAALMTKIDGLSLSPVKGLMKGETYRIKAKARMNKVARPKYLKFVLFFLNTWKLETRWESVNFIF